MRPAIKEESKFSKAFLCPQKKQLRLQQLIKCPISPLKTATIKKFNHVHSADPVTMNNELSRQRYISIIVARLQHTR